MTLRNSNWLPKAILAAAAVLTSMTTTLAQDVRAVERRLGGAIEAGELTIEQAKIMLDVLKKSAGRRAKDVKAKFANAQERLRRAVANGDLSAADARKKLAALKQSMTDKPITDRAPQVRWNVAGQKDAKAKFANAQERLRRAVANGDLSAADARKKLAALKQSMTDKPITDRAPQVRWDVAGQKEGKANRGANARQQQMRKQYAGIQKRVEIAVKQGRITPEQGKQRLAEARKRMAADAKKQKGADRKPAEQRAARQRYADYEKRVKQAAENGRLTPEQATKMLEQARQRMFGKRPDQPGAGKQQRNAKRSKPDARGKTQVRDTAQASDDATRDARERRRRRFANLKLDVEAAVERGEMTPEAAGKKLFDAEREAARQQETRQQESLRQAAPKKLVSSVR